MRVLFNFSASSSWVTRDGKSDLKAPYTPSRLSFCVSLLMLCSLFNTLMRCLRIQEQYIYIYLKKDHSLFLNIIVPLMTAQTMRDHRHQVSLFESTEKKHNKRHHHVVLYTRKVIDWVISCQLFCQLPCQHSSHEVYTHNNFTTEFIEFIASVSKHTNN